MKGTKTIAYIGIGIIIAFLLYGLLWTCNQNKKLKTEAEGDHTYKTDTIYQKEFVPQPYPVPIEVPPKVVTVYVEKPQAPSSTKIIYRDTGRIVIQYLNKTDTEYVYIDPEFLKNYPSHPKILEARLAKRKFTLTTYYINNEILTHEYPLNLDKYEYRWDTSGLTTKVLRQKFKPIGSSEFTALFDPFHNSGELAVDYTLSFGRLGLMVQPYARYEVRPKTFTLGAQGGLKYRLK